MEDNLYKLIVEKSKITAKKRLTYVTDPDRVDRLHRILEIVNRPKTNLTELLIQLRENSVHDPVIYSLLDQSIEYSIKGETANLVRTLMNYKDYE